MKRAIVLIMLCALITVCWAGPVPPYVSIFMRTVLDDTTALLARTTLGIGEGDSPTFVKTTLSGNEINIATAQTPASPTAAGTQGDVAWDTNYIYVAVAGNTWKRAALSTWAGVTENVIYAGENVIFAGEQVVYP